MTGRGEGGAPDPVKRPVRAPGRGPGTGGGSGAERSGRAGDAEPDGPPRLAVSVAGAQVDRSASSPTVLLTLAVEGPPGREVGAALLRAQVRILPRRRSYDPATRERLVELFGEPSRWGTTLRSLLWTRATVVVPRFTGRTELDLPLPCTYDFEVAAAKYLHGLRDGTVPLELLFNGTVFYPGPGGALRTAMLPWDLDTRHDLPAGLWREAMDRFFPDSGWIRLSRDTFDRLYAFKAARGIPTWEGAMERLLGSAGAAGEDTGAAADGGGQDGNGHRSGGAGVHARSDRPPWEDAG